MNSSNHDMNSLQNIVYLTTILPTCNLGAQQYENKQNKMGVFVGTHKLKLP